MEQSLFSILWEKQITLVNHYQKIYGLPSYPLPIDDPSAQETIRHLISSLVEEVIELSEAHLGLVELLDTNGGLDKTTPKGKELLSELADVLHFILEIFIYANITEDSIKSYLAACLSGEYEVEALETWWGLLHAHRAKEEPSPRYIAMLNLEANRSPLELLVCSYEKNTTHMAYQIIYFSQIAQNCLKNKAWKKTKVETDVDKFQQNLVLCFQAILYYCVDLGLTPRDIFNIYCSKNKLNLERIEKKY